MLDAARKWQVPRVAVASPLGVYEGVPETPHREDARLRLPVDPVPAIMLAKELVAALAAQDGDRRPGRAGSRTRPRVRVDPA